MGTLSNKEQGQLVAAEKRIRVADRRSSAGCSNFRYELQPIPLVMMPTDRGPWLKALVLRGQLGGFNRLALPGPPRSSD